MTETEKRVPELRFEGFIDDWEQRELKEILKVNSGRDYKHLGSGSIPVYGTGGYMLSVNDKLSDKDAIGIGRKGTIDKPQYLKAPFWTVDTLFFMIPLNNFDLQFLYTMTQKINWKKMDESTGVPSLSKAIIEKVNQNIPSYQEQIKIGDFFKQLDNTIALHQRKLNLLKLLKQTYLNTLFAQNGENSPALRFAGFSESWEQRKLGDIVDVLDGDRGKNYPSVNEFYENEHTLFLNASNVTKNGFSFQNNQFISEQKSNSLGNGKVQVDDIVLTSRGSLGHIAWYNNAVHKNIPNARINSGMLLLRSTSKTTPSYIMQYLKSPLGKKQIDFLSFGSAQPQLTKKDVVDYRIKIPSNIEQETIGRFFSSFDNAIVLHQFKFEKLLELKNVLLGKMFL